MSTIAGGAGEDRGEGRRGGGFKRKKYHPSSRGRGRGRDGRGEQRFTVDRTRSAVPTFDYSSSDGVARQEPESVDYTMQPLATCMLPQSALPVTNKVNPNSRTSSTTMSQMTKSRFMDLPLSTPTQRAISEVLGYETMTAVQHFAIPPGLAGEDVLAKAKTGTGKTLSFLLPAIEGVAKIPRYERRGLSALIISPTRELAQQIAEEACQVLTYHDVGLLCIVGGKAIRADIKGFRRSPPPDILVATPGRLNDHLQNHDLQSYVKDLQHLVFDEADQLLEMGFRPAIQAILRYLPAPERRQTLMFSATMPPDVRQMVQMAMKAEHKFVDCIGEEESTHEHVAQFYTICDPAYLAQELTELVRENIKADPQGHKIIVFFTTARLTQFYAQLFNFMNLHVLEIHSRKTQGHRSKVSAQFRNGHGVVMFTSDVSARGMDYPDVTAVIQVGLPADKAQYIHRLGRTARAGKGGFGVLLLCEFESRFLSEVQELPIQERYSLSHETLEAATPCVNAAFERIEHDSATAAYQAWLGFYNGQLRRLGWDREALVAYANSWITSICRQPEVPALPAKTLGKMNLRQVRGIVEERSGNRGRQKDRGGRGHGHGNASGSRGGGRGRGNQGRGGGGRGRGGGGANSQN